MSQEQRTARNFPEEAILHCRSGLTALRGNLPDQARGSLLRALSLNPMIWEAFEGLCSLGDSGYRILLQSLLMSSFGFAGSVPEIEDLFPSRPPPIKRTSPDEQQQQPPTRATHPPRPTATGLGFFTPDNGNSGNLFRRPEPPNALPVRMGRLGPRDSMWAGA